MKFLICLMLFVTAVFATPKKETVAFDLPYAIKDSLPWFAVREMDKAQSPFTKNHLAIEAAKAKRTVLVFFATWCIPCKEGISQLVQKNTDLDNQRLKIILVNTGIRETEREKISLWVKELGAASFKLVQDSYGKMIESFGLVDSRGEIALPKILVIDNKMKPLYLYGQEGDDFPNILWEK